MKFLAHLFVGQPLHILAVAGLFLAGYGVLRLSSFGAGRHSRPLLVAALGWLLYAVWEWFVLARTPEANIRVDLLLIWPVLAILSGWGLYRAFR